MACPANISDDYQVILIGAASVGKTCIIKKWTINEFSDEYIPTKYSTDHKEIEVRSRKCKVEILDTAGLSQYWGMRDNMIRQADGIMIVFSITDEGSFEMLKELHQQVERNISESSCVLLVGNKHDLSETRKVTYDSAWSFSEHLGLDYIETSARVGHNIVEAFVHLIEAIMDKRLQNAPPQRTQTKNTKCRVM
ncbi:hypothetical protein ACHWQZ_G008785 [Mnemiopsis leidyi]